MPPGEETEAMNVGAGEEPVLQLAAMGTRVPDPEGGFDFNVAQMNPTGEVAFAQDDAPVEFSRVLKCENQRASFLGGFLRAAKVVDAGESLVIAAPPSTGKTTFALWAATSAFRRGQRFAVVVPDCAKCHDVHHALVVWPLPGVGHRCGRAHADGAPEDEAGDRGVVITARELHRVLFAPTERDAEQNRFGAVIFDDFSQLEEAADELGPLLEEIVALLPRTQLVVTTPLFANVEQLACWLATVQLKRCFFVRSRHRPYGYAVHLTVRDARMEAARCFQVMRVGRGREEKLAYDEAAFQRAMECVRAEPEERDARDYRQLTKPIRLAVDAAWDLVQQWCRTPVQKGGKTVGVLNNRFMLAVVTFSDRDCQAAAFELADQFRFTTGTSCRIEERTLLRFAAEDREQIEEVLDGFYDRVNVEELAESADYKLVEGWRHTALRGVGFFYAEMPLVLRQLFNDLCRRGLVKVLVLTEATAANATFRADAVIVSACRKWDGRDYRYFTNREFQRLFGFASRNFQFPVFLAVDRPAESRLSSVYRPTVAAVRSCCRKAAGDERVFDRRIMTAILRKTFFNFCRLLELEEIRKAKNLAAHELAAIPEGQFKALRLVLDAERALEEAERELDVRRYRPELIADFLANGRLVHIVDGERDFGWAAVVRFTPAAEANPRPTLLVALRLTRDALDNRADFRLVAPPHPDELRDARGRRLRAPVGIVRVPVESVRRVGRDRLRLPREFRSADSLQKLRVLINGLNEENLAMQPLDIGGHPEIAALKKRAAEAKAEVERHSRDDLDDFPALLRRFNERQAKAERLDEWERKLQARLEDAFAVEIEETLRSF
ncbi:Antiviral helicase [Aphelenchoides fujianensis]|nr:Antiviral helicase [Aphelenchoides fujianensis]